MMKKPLILILIFSLTINLASAQKERKRILIINSGLSIPFSEFAYQRMVTDAGFAGTGMNVGIDYLSSKGRFLGFYAAAGYSILNFNEDNYKSEYERIMNETGAVRVTAGNYHIFKTVVGLSGKTPEFYHIEILFFLQAGYSLSIHPEIIVTHTSLGIINSVKQDQDWTGISNLGMKVHYHISEKYAVSCGWTLNYLYPGFEDEGPVSYFDLPMRFANLNLGFLINL